MSNGYRNITVDEKDYEYKVGRSHVDIRPPDGARMTPDFHEITGLSWDEIERRRHKGGLSVTPHQISAYIAANVGQTCPFGCIFDNGRLYGDCRIPESADCEMNRRNRAREQRRTK